MKTYLECIPCFLEHSLDVSRLATQDTALQQKIVKSVLRVVCNVRFEEPPPLTTARIHRAIRSLTGEVDPYRGFKRAFNQIALGLFQEMKARVEGSRDRFETALRMAVAGNTIDCITAVELDESQLLESIEDSLSCPLDGNAVADLASSVREAKRILYIGDNAGEIVFDRLLLEEMPAEKLTFAVRGANILNDATVEDAAETGVSQQVRTIDTGSDVPGIVLSECSEVFRRCFEKADLVIAKGQGNFETLSETEKPIWFLFKVKCPVVSVHTASDIGRAMVYRGGTRRASNVGRAEDRLTGGEVLQ